MTKQCPSCGGDCGRTKNFGCRYKNSTCSGLLTDSELADIKAIVAKWDYATEACIEAYILGINRRRKAMFDFTKEHDVLMSQAEALWGTENTPKRESMAFKDGFHAALLIMEENNDE